MRRYLVGLALALQAGLLTGISANAGGLEPWQEQLLQLMKLEKRVADALWNDSQTFWVSVKDDGTPRDGYAESVCVTAMFETDVPRPNYFTVQVIDLAAMKRGEFVMLGSYPCQIKAAP